ncbi:VWA domain-containing protein [Aureimonas fodinaquatilis]|uniref:VWA domain-containing protein n=1 Tax=Aureimonas fodinaquatilis TaxID=2565783 RepID=A0A5B0DUP0_9HYPH|nr:VWA domain-containing protein [Aureimonas fodinaquatilis]KAA0969501.1 VWA domain-containing protein [Aureimonas fodinaquatilis]
MWSFSAPLMFLLMPLPLVLRWLAPAREGAAGALLVPPAIAGILGAGRPGSVLANAGSVLLPALAWLALVFALAGPQQLLGRAALPVSGRDVVLVLDLSGSMEAEDFEIDGQPVQRLEAVKRMAAHFARQREGDRLGLVVFGQKAYVAVPMTYDVNSVAEAIEGATIGISGRSTAISDGLGLAIKRLASSDAPSRVILLLSDGVDTSGTVTPGSAASYAAGMGIRLHTIAMGLTVMGEAAAGRDAVDAATLKVMAEATGGESFIVRTTDELNAVGQAIDRMEANAQQRPAVALYASYWMYPAALSLLMLLAIVALGWRRWQ